MNATYRRRYNHAKAQQSDKRSEVFSNPSRKNEKQRGKEEDEGANVRLRQRVTKIPVIGSVLLVSGNDQQGVGNKNDDDEDNVKQGFLDHEPH
jgi:hypothetical protein